MQDYMPDELEVLQELEQEAAAAIEPPVTDQYKESDEVQRNIVGALLTDRQFLVHSLGIVRPYYFTNEAHQVMAKAALNHFERYKQIPAKQFVCQEMEDAIANKAPEIKQYYRTEFYAVYDYFVPGVEAREYLLDRITNFAKIEALKTAFTKSLDELKKKQSQETWLKIHDILRSALSIDRSFEPGLDYFQTFEERYAKMAQNEENHEIFTIGFPAIDNALVGGGLSRGEIGSWMGSPGTGKSLALVAGALANMHLGKRVLYLSLEMDEDKVAQRFDAQLATLNKQNQGKVTINNLLEHKEVVFDCLKEYVSEFEDPHLLVIRQFPAGALDIAQLRSYLTQMKMRGFCPDLLVLDYVGEMKDYPNMPTWESRNKIARDLRGIAVEENICILTAMQPDRRARDQSNEKEHLGFIDDSNLADAYGQSRPLDALWSINQFQDEKDCGLARIFVAKHRHGKSRFTFHVEFDYTTLRMSEVSEYAYEKRIKEYRNSKEVLVKKNTEKELKNRKMEQEVDHVCNTTNIKNALQSLGEEDGYQIGE